MTGRLELDIELDRGDFRLAVREDLELDGITAIFGASGSGKTSLLRVIAGLEAGARGRIRFRDSCWQDADRRLPAEARAIGYVFQDGRLFPHLDVRGNLEFPLRHGRRHGRPGLADTVAALGLEPLLGRRPSSLSGGERQRVAIGRALLAAPALMLMDEPLSSLDLGRKRELLPLIRALPEEFNVPVIYVTHNLDELVYLADRVLLLHGGRSSGQGSVRETLDRADFASLADIDEPGSILEARIREQSGGLTIAALGDSELRLPAVAGTPGSSIRLRVDPRDVILALEVPHGLSIRNRLAVVIRALETRDDGQVDAILELSGQRLTARITVEAVAELGLATGQRVIALIKTAALEGVGSTSRMPTPVGAESQNP